ncbi:MAG: hypothetical protein JKX91_08770 [Rhizobiaceae bacterium]|nr:hypothetical protein [Rhizobiaceae bacterium]
MTNKTIKSTIAALALVVLATSGGTASAGVASMTLGNISPAAIQAGESEIAPIKVGNRRHRGHRRHHGGNWGHGGYGHGGGWGYNCRIKKRFWDGYGYYYRYVNVCRY